MKSVFKNLMAAALFATLAVSVAVRAEEGPFATFPIRIENNPVTTDVSPNVAEPITKNQVAFNIVNNTGRALYFEDTQKTYIPVVSHTTVVTTYAPGQTYKVSDADGKTVATWSLGNQSFASSSASASSEQFAAWETSLQQVIANQKVSYVEPPKEAEPAYREATKTTTVKSSTTTGTTVRGFW